MGAHPGCLGCLEERATHLLLVGHFELTLGVLSGRSSLDLFHAGTAQSAKLHGKARLTLEHPEPGALASISCRTRPIERRLSSSTQAPMLRRAKVSGRFRV